MFVTLNILVHYAYILYQSKWDQLIIVQNINARVERNAQACGICMLWRYTAHYTWLFLAGHAQARTSAHERAGTSGPKINGDGVLTAH